MNEKIPHSTAKQKPGAEEGLSRRDVLRLGGAFVATALLRSSERKEGENRKSSEFFNDEISGYETLYGNLQRDEVLFVDDRNRPIGGPVSLVPIDGIEVGQFDSNGLIVGRINQQWLNAQRERICAAHTEDVTCDVSSGLPKVFTSISALREAVEDGLDPETILDVVTYYGEQEVIGGDGLNRIQYVQTIEIDGVPDSVQNEIQRVIVGLCAQESNYHNGKESPVGAKGIFQFMPATWRELGYEEEDLLRLTNQVEAASKYLSRTYRNLQRNAGEALERLKTNLFAGDEEKFNRYMIVPLMINSYNSGDRRMTEAVEWFEGEYGTKERFERLMGKYEGDAGYDVFFALTQTVQSVNQGVLAGYGDDASQYVPRIYAFAKLLSGKY